MYKTVSRKCSAVRDKALAVGFLIEIVRSTLRSPNETLHTSNAWRRILRHTRPATGQKSEAYFSSI
jgi:hypothetical protein